MNSRVMREEFGKRKEENAVFMEEMEINSEIPESFDSRQNWRQCRSIGTILDQSSCGSCWAFCSAEVMSDRTCIATSKQYSLSTEDILNCCPTCGNGCNGGWPIYAFQFWQSNGVCTGFNYPTHELLPNTCKPYSVGKNTVCRNKCQPFYSTPYPKDKHYGASAYYISTKVEAIQKEIMTNGPVTTIFTVYEDFYHYTSGIYVHTGGVNKGAHCVKIIGWGFENQTPYWLVANSWGPRWGENGLFRIRRGTNEVGFESNLSAGMPKV